MPAMKRPPPAHRIDRGRRHGRVGGRWRRGKAGMMPVPSLDPLGQRGGDRPAGVTAVRTVGLRRPYRVIAKLLGAACTSFTGISSWARE